MKLRKAKHHVQQRAALVWYVTLNLGGLKFFRQGDVETWTGDVTLDIVMVWWGYHSGSMGRVKSLDTKQPCL